MGLYILDDQHRPQPVDDDDVTMWGQWLHHHDNKRVAWDEVDGKRISTVFLGIDHNYFGDGPPVLFETMVFGGKHDEEQWRCCTWDEAVAQHAWVLARVKLEEAQ